MTWSLTAWTLDTQTLATRATKAQAWETQAVEVQVRANQLKQPSVAIATAPSVLKPKPSDEEVLVKLEGLAHIEEEKSEIFFSRSVWPSKFEYILAQIGYCVRPSHLWRFAHLWLHNGGCSFVIIYILMLFLIGIPLLFLEMAAGQRMRQSSIGLWKMFSPWIGGVGYTSVMVNFITGTYLNVVNAWVLFYMSQSFQFPVPWEKCPLLKNSSDFDTIDDGGPPVLSLSLPFFVSWCLIGACMISGLKSIGKMSSLYSVNTWSLAGSQVLFNFGLGFGPIAALASHTAQSNNCLGDALIVALFSLVALLVILPFIFSILGFWATIITHRCCEKNAETILKLISAGKLPSEAQPPENLLENPTSIYNAWLNILPQHIRSAVLREVPECNKEKQFLKVKEGSSFAFLSFVEAMSFLPGSILWSVFFLLVLLTLEMSTMIGMVYTIITSVQDTFSSLRKHAKLLTAISGLDPDTFPLVGVCMLMFLCGIFFVQPSGIYFIILLSEYWTVIPIVVIIVLENIAVAWAYGARRSVLMLMKLISKGILPQAAKPPKDILLRPPLDYLDWISTLPQHLQYQVIRLSLSCAITVQKGKIMEGPGLSYAAFSQAVSLFPGASFWAIVFFLALFITGLGTLIRLSEGIVLPLQNTIPIFIKHPKVVPVIVCLGGLLSSLVFSSEAGSYIMCLVDDHVVPLTIAVIMIFQNMGLAWIYGAKRFRQEIFSKLGHLLLPIFTFLWCYVTLPGLLGLLAICLVQLYHRGTPYYVAWNSSASQEVRQPYLKRDLGWVTFLSILTLLPIPVYLLHHWWYFHDPIVSDTSKKPQSFRKTAMRLTKPLQWPKRPMGKSQNKGSKTSVRALSPPTTKVQDVDSWQPTDKDLKEGQLERSLVHSVSD
ncbi:Orphan sodium- and chloride-dependent neurotransmitter transporter NTT5 [Tupaia chinensis]|uniref:Orphan sodium-and chloride-dependent neurotransmitter transporter NTT5 n=1 Tax=Tupaia chinensis TaxID=246437 RepID=L9J988_TUPCH|nr:Orphan sodium- and chloride-dependent neurotransmitter transporter NTT5 [Tupaia chinensis]